MRDGRTVRQPPKAGILGALAGAGRGLVAMGFAAAVLVTMGACYLVVRDIDR